MKPITHLYAWLFIATLFSTACSTTYQSKIGMSKQQVYASLGHGPDNFIGAKQYPKGTLEVIQFSHYDAINGHLHGRYWLYFFNDQLKQWGRPGDWQKEADQIYKSESKPIK
jgi:hypothetical protein